MPISKTIIHESPSTMRAMARQVLKGRWFEAFLVLLISYLLTNVPAYVLEHISDAPAVQWISSLYNILISGPVSLGLAAYFLKVFRRKPGGPSDLKEAFSLFNPAVTLYINIWFYTFLWTLLFIVPGIIAAIRYSQAWFILADDPSKSPRQCIEESKYMMEGNKATFALLILSFFGWIFLSNIPQVLVQYLTDPDFVTNVQNMMQYGASQISPVSVKTNIWVELAALLSIFVEVYVYASEACFYDLLTGNIVVAQQSDYNYTEESNGSL